MSLYFLSHYFPMCAPPTPPAPALPAKPLVEMMRALSLLVLVIAAPEVKQSPVIYQRFIGPIGAPGMAGLGAGAMLAR